VLLGQRNDIPLIYKDISILKYKMSSFLENLTWRRALKSFRPSDTQIDITPILDAIVEAPSSFGLQPYKVLIVKNASVKAILAPVCYNQPQIETCSHILLFCTRNDLEERIEEYVRNTHASTDYTNMIETAVANQSHKTQWAKHQTYIALGFALAAAAERKIATCPMEGFSKEGVATALDLPSNLTPTVILTIGHENPDVANPPRYRFPRTDILATVEEEGCTLPAAPRSRYRNVTPRRKKNE